MGSEQTLSMRAGGQELAGNPRPIAKLVPFITTQQQKGEDFSCNSR